MNDVIKGLCALRSDFDAKVTLEYRIPQQGSRQWPQIGFSKHSFETGVNGAQLEARNLAAFDIFGQAAKMLKGVSGYRMLSSYGTGEKDSKGREVYKPMLHIVCVPEGTAGAVARDVVAEVTEWTEKFVSAGGDIANIPAIAGSNNGILLGYLKSATTKLNTAAAVGDIDAAPAVGDATGAVEEQF